MNNIEQIIKDAIENNKENIRFTVDEYAGGYVEGYNDALVDLLNTLGIENNYKIYND